MVLGLEFTPATVVVALVVAFLAFLAARRLWRNGMCDCHKDDPRGGCSGMCAGCSGCSAVEHMVHDMQNAAHPQR